MELLNGAKDISETMDDETRDQEACNLSPTEASLSSTVHDFDTRKTFFKRNSKYFKIPRSSVHMDVFKAAYDITEQFDYKKSDQELMEVTI